MGAALALAVAGTAQAAATPAQVVHAWSKALNANHNVVAANLFAHNARILQPGVDARLTSHALAVLFNASLPCAGAPHRALDTISHRLYTPHRKLNNCSGTSPVIYSGSNHADGRIAEFFVAECALQ